MIDHLFRHQSGKMVASLVRVFGLSNLNLIEDAVQDTFIKAMAAWQMNQPENPEAWLMRAAKNRAIDLLRSGKIRMDNISNVQSGSVMAQVDEFFTANEIEDAQLRMIFTVCHPKLSQQEQIAFALKCISGFGDKEIAAALLSKTDTIKKRLQRARKSIRENDIKFEIPSASEINERMQSVCKVLYLIFNEGYHSSSPDKIVRKDLCAEAIRLISLLLKQEKFRNGYVYAIYSIFCLHAAKMEAKLSDREDLIDLKNQDRSLWNIELIQLGNVALNKAMDYDKISAYHLEAAILAEYVNAETYASTNWEAILNYFEFLSEFHPSELTKLNIALIHIQSGALSKAEQMLNEIDPEKLNQRMYMYYGVCAELSIQKGKIEEAIEQMQKAVKCAQNIYEKAFMEKKIAGLKSKN